MWKNPNKRTPYVSKNSNVFITQFELFFIFTFFTIVFNSFVVRLSILPPGGYFVYRILFLYLPF